MVFWKLGKRLEPAALTEPAQQPATANPSCWYTSFVLKKPSLLKSGMARRSSLLGYPCRLHVTLTV